MVQVDGQVYLDMCKVRGLRVKRRRGGRLGPLGCQGNGCEEPLWGQAGRGRLP